jgi:hypothetical protein
MGEREGVRGVIASVEFDGIPSRSEGRLWGAVGGFRRVIACVEIDGIPSWSEGRLWANLLAVKCQVRLCGRAAKEFSNSTSNGATKFGLVQIVLVEAVDAVVVSSKGRAIALEPFPIQNSRRSARGWDGDRSRPMKARIADGEEGAKMSGELDAGDMRGLSREEVPLHDRGARNAAPQRRDLHWCTNAEWSRKPAWFKRG